MGVVVLVFCGVAAVTSNVVDADPDLYPLAEMSTFRWNIPGLEFGPISREYDGFISRG
jgi:hypothetical protein